MTDLALQKQWIWIKDWQDESAISAAGLVTFERNFVLDHIPAQSIIHFSADTRYKLFINEVRVSIGPSRGCQRIWYYDSVDVGPFLRVGHNRLVFDVCRFYPRGQTGFPFARTRCPGLAVHGVVQQERRYPIDLGSATSEWRAWRHPDITFPMGSQDDFFLHVYERLVTGGESKEAAILRYNFNTGTGEATPWHLEPRLTPFPEESPCEFSRIRQFASSSTAPKDWRNFLAGEPLRLAANSRHCVDIEAICHSTALVSWTFQKQSPGTIFKVLYAEGYEQEPKEYPWLRFKGNRTDDREGRSLYGPFDLISFQADKSGGQPFVYQPFWFRTFRFLRVEIEVGNEDMVIGSLSARQVNYPLSNVATLESGASHFESSMWDVSVRTLRNCMFDGYSDCPFYEQLQYAEDTRSSGLFHYLLCGDDRLMRQAIIGFAASITPNGLIQSRYPSHVEQIIPGFALFWILQVCDHHLFFNDSAFTKRFIPVMFLVLNFFRDHIDSRGLVSGLPIKYWQFVDWADEWAGTPEWTDGGVPTQGRRSNTFSFITMLLLYVLREAQNVLHSLGSRYLETELATISSDLRSAINRHCFDGVRYVDSTTDQPPSKSSQHAQVFAVLSGAATGDLARRILYESFELDSSESTSFAKCSYVMTFYAFRAFSMVSRRAYTDFWNKAWTPWRHMLAMNLSTWEEDPVTQRSDCHAWGSIPIYEYLIELVGIKPLAPGWGRMSFSPRPELLPSMDCEFPLGSRNRARVCWSSVNGIADVRLRLAAKVEIRLDLPDGSSCDIGFVDRYDCSWSEDNHRDGNLR